jgi:amino acid adenylation domain-containing protein
MESALKDSVARRGARSSNAFVKFLVAECEQPIHYRFERQAIRSPDAPAVRLLSRDIPYKELNIVANRTARMLLANAATDSRPIALMLDQGYESILWTLAILKAGLCYAPLDQRLPEPVLHTILKDLAPGALIASTRYRDACRSFAAGRFPVITTDTPCDGFASENLDEPSTAEAVAYVFYTSGSTGAPKGVVDSHRNVLHNILRYTNSLKFGPGDVLSLVQNPSFSGTVSTLFGALLNGAASAPFDLQTDGLQTLSQWLRRAHVTVFHAVPSIFRQLSDPVARFPAIRLIRLEGDRASPLDIAHFRENFQEHCTLVHGFGATECGLVRQFFIGKDAHFERNEPVPVGYPVTDMTVRIVDDRGYELPSGSTGEIVVESRFLATGYWRNAALTAERFVTLGEGLRGYRTGDLGRINDNGCLFHLGRVDQRIRVAGEFVAPADIETVLLDVPGISQVAVREFVDRLGEHRLCAYLVTQPETLITVTRLRKALSERIAKHHMPTAFVFLHALPLTKDHKIDYAHLPQPGSQRPPLSDTYIAPRTPLEQKLAKIWEDVLDIRPIGIHDNFLDLGGYSLSAVRLFARIEKVTGKNLPVAALFHAPTIEQLARRISHQGGAAPWKSLAAIQPAGSRPPFFCVHAHDGDVLFWRDLARHLGPDQPFYAFQPQGLDGRQPPHTRFEAMASHYIGEIRTRQPEGPYFIGGHCIGGLIAFEMAQQLHTQGERVAALVLFDSYAPGGERSVRSSLIDLCRSQSIRAFEMTVGLHVNNLLILESQERLSYLKRKFNKALYKLYMGFGSAWIPAARHRRSILKAGSQASRHYHPTIYPGNITLFRASDLGGGIDHDPQMGWGRLAGGGLETHVIPGYHAHIVLEPRVRVLAQHVIAALRKADKMPASETTVPA